MCFEYTKYFNSITRIGYSRLNDFSVNVIYIYI